MPNSISSSNPQGSNNSNPDQQTQYGGKGQVDSGILQQQATNNNSGARNASNSLALSNQGGINNFSVNSNNASGNSSLPLAQAALDVNQVQNLDLTQLFASGQGNSPNHGLPGGPQPNGFNEQKTLQKMYAKLNSTLMMNQNLIQRLNQKMKMEVM